LLGCHEILQKNGSQGPKKEDFQNIKEGSPGIYLSKWAPNFNMINSFLTLLGCPNVPRAQGRKNVGFQKIEHTSL